VVLHQDHLDLLANLDHPDHRVHLAKTRLNQQQLDLLARPVMLVIKDRTAFLVNWVYLANVARLANPVVVTIALNRRRIRVTILVMSIKESRKPKTNRKYIYSSN